MTGATIDTDNIITDVDNWEGTGTLTNLNFKSNVHTHTWGFEGTAADQRYSVNLLQENGFVTVFIYHVCPNESSATWMINSKLSLTGWFN